MTKFHFKITQYLLSRVTLIGAITKIDTLRPCKYERENQTDVEIIFSAEGGSCKISLTSDQVYYSD